MANVDDFPKWEYNMVNVSLKRQRSEHVEQMLNIMGESGWELVGISGDFAYFKRSY